jgi:hypothetical protein
MTEYELRAQLECAKDEARELRQKLTAAEAKLLNCRMTSGRTIAAMTITAGGKVHVSRKSQIDAGNFYLIMDKTPCGDIIFTVRSALAQEPSE